MRQAYARPARAVTIRSVGRAQRGWSAGERQKCSKRETADDGAGDTRSTAATSRRSVLSTTAFPSVKAQPPIPGMLLGPGEPVSGRAPSAQVRAMLSVRRNLLGDQMG